MDREYVLRMSVYMHAVYVLKGIVGIEMGGCQTHEGSSGPGGVNVLVHCTSIYKVPPLQLMYLQRYT